MARLCILLTIISLCMAVISCQPSEVTQTPMVVVTAYPPLQELVKIHKVEADDQIEIAKVEILPGFGLQVDRPGSTPRPPQMSFTIVATSRNKGPAGTIRTQITIEDPLTGETKTTGVDEFVESGGMTGPHLGFFVEEKPWAAYVEVHVVP